jgi:hypothetical protein
MSDADEYAECLDCGCDPCVCDDGDAYDEDDELALMNCGMMADGLCSMAGSEECDWKCPIRRVQLRGRA